MKQDRRDAPQQPALLHPLEVCEQLVLRHPELLGGRRVGLGHDRHIALQRLDHGDVALVVGLALDLGRRGDLDGLGERVGAPLHLQIHAPVVLAGVSEYFRAAAGAALRRVETWLALGAMTAIVFSFGPTLDSHGRTILPKAPYLLGYLYVPGVNGLRVPARLAMVAILFLSMLAACGFTAMANRWRRSSWIVCASFGILFVLEAAVAPLPLDRPIPMGHFFSPPGGLPPLSAPPPVYRDVAALPADAALVELPYGIVEWDLARDVLTRWRTAGRSSTAIAEACPTPTRRTSPRSRIPSSTATAPGTRLRSYRPHISSFTKARFRAVKVRRFRRWLRTQGAVEDRPVSATTSCSSCADSTDRVGT